MLWAQQATFEHQEGIWLEVAQQLIVPTLAQPCLVEEVSLRMQLKLRTRRKYCAHAKNPKKAIQRCQLHPEYHQP